MRFPPLRERLEDIPALCEHFISKINSEAGGNTPGISPDVITLFQQYKWPGNVRELEHTLERLCFQSQNRIITLEDCGFFKEKLSLSETLESNAETGKHNPGSEKDSLRFSRKQAETEAIMNALKQCHGNKSQAAKLLGIDKGKCNSYESHFPFIK